MSGLFMNVPAAPAKGLKRNWAQPPGQGQALVDSGMWDLRQGTLGNLEPKTNQRGTTNYNFRHMGYTAKASPSSYYPSSAEDAEWRPSYRQYAAALNSQSNVDYEPHDTTPYVYPEEERNYWVPNRAALLHHIRPLSETEFRRRVPTKSSQA
eukprot:NODE_3438_length_1221_cov_93.834244_g3262_i0.p1 GENE.NODE_3438_length_1221_cov_93.834244_g3262_i0~~NODE_3438_length_1221_cov_93.834244_g3262_i0.p1  ORF type:complete len:152 (+),score=15.33 NODE_3438_length_1221_cov_93.834244_g3262_i0:110-565(+)